MGCSRGLEYRPHGISTTEVIPTARSQSPTWPQQRCSDNAVSPPVRPKKKAAATWAAASKNDDLLEPRLLARDHNLNAAIGAPPFGRAVVRDRILFATTDGPELRSLDAGVRQEVDDLLGPKL